MQHHPQYKFMSDTYFPCTFIGHQQSVIILWCYPTDDKLTILTDHQQQLICFKNKDELKNHPINQLIPIEYNDHDCTLDILDPIDFEQTFNIAKHLTPYEIISPETCNILLTSVNMLEDILKGFHLHNHDKYHKNFHHILNKFLFGEHLEVLAPPEGEELYHASLTPYEIRWFKRHLRQHYRRIAHNVPALAPIFMTTQSQD